MKLDLSIVIPAFNEAERIGATIEKFYDYLEQETYTYEIIVADDGSTDGTVQLILELQYTLPNLKLVRLATNKGKGQAVRAGMLAAEGKIRVFSDADGATPIHELKKLIAPIKNKTAKIAIGSRYLEESKILKAQPFYRVVWSRLANKIVQRILLPGIIDPNCGFKAFEYKTAVQLFSQSTVNEWSFDLEILGMAYQLEIEIIQIPVDWTHDERSKGRLSQLPREIINLFQIKRKLSQQFQTL